ncbi:MULTISPECIES: carbon monoxide dehydrogenase [unclassified Lysinibacillus]|uniref:carbon monoxide dehydrogenase n=1 Tax=unclassified Lysinibacillus TaxID=2636778 RepID=UPI0038198A31
MLKKSLYMIPIIFLFSANEWVTANFHTPPPSFEEKFAEGGYISVEKSVKKFEYHCKCKVKLPQLMPPISFTHQFGKFYEDKKYNVNDALSIMFVNKEIKENIYKIEIRSIENKISFKDKLNFKGKEYTLQDDTKAIYFEDQLFNFFVFEKNNLQYLLGIYKEVTNTDTPHTLVKIANSLK